MYVWVLQKAIIFLIIACVMLYVYVNLSLFTYIDFSFDINLRTLNGS